MKVNGEMGTMYIVYIRCRIMTETVVVPMLDTSSVNTCMEDTLHAFKVLYKYLTTIPDYELQSQTPGELLDFYRAKLSTNVA